MDAARADDDKEFAIRIATFYDGAGSMASLKDSGRAFCRLRDLMLEQVGGCDWGDTTNASIFKTITIP